MFDGWITWTNVFYILGLCLATFGTIVSAKWRSVVKEASDVFRALDEALEDGEIDSEEKEKIMKEILQLGYAGVRAAWFIGKK